MFKLHRFLISSFHINREGELKTLFPVTITYFILFVAMLHDIGKVPDFTMHGWIISPIQKRKVLCFYWIFLHNFSQEKLIGMFVF